MKSNRKNRSSIIEERTVFRASFFQNTLKNWNSSKFTYKKLRLVTEAAIQRCSYKTVFWKYDAILQENTFAEVRFQ